MSNLKQKIGKIKISSHLIDQFDEGTFQALFSEFYPFRIEDEYLYKTYWGFSNWFMELNEGSKIPFYEIVFKRNEDGTSIIETVNLSE